MKISIEELRDIVNGKNFDGSSVRFLQQTQTAGVHDVLDVSVIENSHCDNKNHLTFIFKSN